MTKGPPENLPNLLPNPPGFDVEARIEQGKREATELKRRHQAKYRRDSGQDVPDGEVFTPMMSLGFCPACELALNATYWTVRRNRVAYHLGCDPEAPEPLCGHCGVATDTSGAVGGALACDDCYPVAYAMMMGSWLTTPSEPAPWPESVTRSNWR